MFSFFFQAEDGIRDLTVTGVQTCALPISKDKSRDRASGPAREGISASAQRTLARQLLAKTSVSRSEEHTSELQSQSNLVCRLLLEKKKKHKACRGLAWAVNCTLLIQVAWS